MCVRRLHPDICRLDQLAALGGMAGDESAERECESLRARTEKLDLEFPIRDRPLLADELVEPLLGHGAITRSVDIGAMRRAGRLPVDQHTEFDGCSRRRRSHHYMKVTRVKAVRDPAAGLIQ